MLQIWEHLKNRLDPTISSPKEPWRQAQEEGLAALGGRLGEPGDALDLLAEGQAPGSGA